MKSKRYLISLIICSPIFIVWYIWLFANEFEVYSGFGTVFSVLGTCSGIAAVILFIKFLYARSNEKKQEEQMQLERERKEREAFINKLNEIDADIKKLPLLVAFKKKYKKDFITFCEELNSYQTNPFFVKTEDNEYFYMYFAKDCFVMINNHYPTDKNFQELVGKGNDTILLKKELLCEKVSINDFKIFSYDDILYIETFVEKGEEKTISSKRPSNLSVAITEDLWGTAVANRKANGNTYTYKTPDSTNYKIVFSSSSKLRPIIVTDMMKFSYSMKSNLKSKLNDLLINKTKDSYLVKTNITNTTNQNSNLDELKKLKELLDAGIITQEEFDAKKKQILGL